MSVEFKAATNFLRSVATAAKVMADALEQAEKDLVAAKAAANARGEFWRLPGAKGSPAVLPGESLKDLSGAEQDDLATYAAEVGVSTMILTDANAVSKLSPSWCVSSLNKQTDSISSKEQLLVNEIQTRKMESSTRLLDRFLIQRERNSAKTVVGVEHVKEAYKMSILKGIVMIEGESLAFPMYKNQVEIEIIPADSEDAKRLPEGAKVVGLMRYAVDFENSITTGS